MPPQPPTDQKCEETCAYLKDGECDDGGTGSHYSLCLTGTDCTDCGTRAVSCAPDGTEMSDGTAGTTCTEVIVDTGAAPADLAAALM